MSFKPHAFEAAPGATHACAICTYSESHSLHDMHRNELREPKVSLRQERKNLTQQFNEGLITSQQFLHDYIRGLPAGGSLSVLLCEEMDRRINAALNPLVYQILKGKLTITLNPE